MLWFYTILKLSFIFIVVFLVIITTCIDDCFLMYCFSICQYSVSLPRVMAINLTYGFKIMEWKLLAFWSLTHGA